MGREKDQVNLIGGELDPDRHDRIDLEEYYSSFAKLRNTFLNKNDVLVNRYGTDYIRTITNEDVPSPRIYDVGNEEPIIIQLSSGLPFKVYNALHHTDDPLITLENNSLFTGVGFKYTVTYTKDRIYISTEEGRFYIVPDKSNLDDLTQFTPTEEAAPRFIRFTNLPDLPLSSLRQDAAYQGPGVSVDGVARPYIRRPSGSLLYHIIPNLAFLTERASINNAFVDVVLYAVGIIANEQEVLYHLPIKQAFLPPFAFYDIGALVAADFATREIYFRPPIPESSPAFYEMDPQNHMPYPNSNTWMDLSVFVGAKSANEPSIDSRDNFIREVRFYKAIVPINRAATRKFEFFSYGLIGKSTAKTFNDDSILFSVLDDGIEPDFSNVPDEINIKDDKGKIIQPFVVTDGFQGDYFPKSAVTTHHVYGSRMLIGRDKKLEMSRIGFLENFKRTIPITEDSALTREFEGDIIWMITSDQGLFIFTNEGIYFKRDTFSVSSLSVEPGANFVINKRVPPLVVNEGVLFLDDNNVIRSLFWSREHRRFNSDTISHKSQHLLYKKEIISWTYQRSSIDTNPVVWANLTDGSVISLTLDGPNRISSFSRHDFKYPVSWMTSDGTFVYMLIAKGNAYEVHRMGNTHDAISGDFSNAAVYPMDGMVTLKDTQDPLTFDAAEKIYSIQAPHLDHLREEDVSVVVDGQTVSSPNDVRDETLRVDENGVLTFPERLNPILEDFSKIHVGRPIVNDIVTLEVNAIKRGSTLTESISSNKAQISVSDMRELYVANRLPDDDSNLKMEKMSVFEFDSNEFGSSKKLINPYTGKRKVTVDGDWQTKGAIAIRNVDPYPFKIRSISRKLTGGRGA